MSTNDVFSTQMKAAAVSFAASMACRAHGRIQDQRRTCQTGREQASNLGEPQRADERASIVIEKVAVRVGALASDTPSHIVGEVGLARSRTAIKDDEPAS
jgi:hypothetical protein